MRVKRILNRILSNGLAVHLIVICFGILYILFIWQTAWNRESDKALQVALSIESTLPLDELKQLPERAEDLPKGNYSQIKKKLMQVIKVNEDARFACLYVERNGIIYILVDSEPENSPDYSPTGQEFSEVGLKDKKTFLDGKPHVSKVVTDRWGIWRSAEVPINDPRTGKVIAVFGMDYNAISWRNRILLDTLQSIIVVLIAIVLVIIARRNARKNFMLEIEIAHRKKAEEELMESEAYFRLLFEFNPQPLIVYDLGSLAIVAVNNSAVNMYGYSREEFLRMKILNLKLPEEYLNFWETLSNPKLNDNTKVWNHKKKDGQVIQVQIHSNNLDFRQRNERLVLLIDVSEKIKMGKALNKSERTLSNLIGNLTGFVYCCKFDEQYSMEYLSEACRAVTDYDPDDIIDNKKLAYSDLILPEYRDFVWEKWNKAIDERAIFDEEYPIKTALGEIKWVWEHGRCVFGENDEIQLLEGYIEDITEKKNAEKELLKLSQAIAQSPVAVVVMNAEGIIEYVNSRYCKMTGFEEFEVIGEKPSIIESGNMSLDFYADLWATVTAGYAWSGEMINKTKSGTFYWSSKSIFPIFDEFGKITNYVSFGDDITEKKKIEDELVTAKDKAEESDRLKSAFLANISHEIRTPMNGILGFAELLKDPSLSYETQKDFLSVIETSGYRMLHIINGLVEISKIESGETTLRIKAANINQMMNEQYEFFLEESQRKNLDFDCYCDLPDKESVIYTDCAKLSMIMSNVIKNALNFTDKGKVSFGYKKKGDMLEFYVSDSGPGISSDKKESIFQRFRQCTANITLRNEGAGLGLAISKAYLESLGSSFIVESELGQGSTFLFSLPYSSTLDRLN